MLVWQLQEVSLLAFLDFTLDSENLFCWYKRKKWFLWAAAQAAENHGDKWSLTWYLGWGIYIYQFQPEPACSRSAKFKDILQWVISQMITNTIPISTRIIISYCMRWNGMNFLMESVRVNDVYMYIYTVYFYLRKKHNQKHNQVWK